MTFFASSLRCREPLDISMARLVEAYRSHPVTPIEAMLSVFCFFPTCQVRVVRFYVSCLVLLLLLSSPPPLVVLLLSLSSSSSCSTATRDPQCSLPDLNHDHRRQCALPDLNHDHPRPVFPAGPQPRPSTPSLPCRTSTTTIPVQCSLPDLNREYPHHAKCSLPDRQYPRQVFPADLMRYAR